MQRKLPLKRSPCRQQTLNPSPGSAAGSLPTDESLCPLAMELPQPSHYSGPCSRAPLRCSPRPVEHMGRAPYLAAGAGLNLSLFPDASLPVIEARDQFLQP